MPSRSSLGTSMPAGLISLSHEGRTSLVDSLSSRLETKMSIGRFVVLHRRGEWLVTYANSDLASFSTREEAEHSAFNAADRLAMNGHAVSVLIMPEGLDADLEGSATIRECISTH